MVYLTSRIKHWLPILLLLAALGISLAVSDEEAAIEARLEEFVQVISQPCGKLRGGVDEEATIETVRSPRATSVDSKVLNSARLKLDLQTNTKQRQRKWHVHIPHRHHIHIPHLHIPHRHHIHIPHRHINYAARRAAAKKAKGDTLESQAVLNELVHRGILREDCSATKKTYAAVSKMLEFTGSNSHPSWTIQSDCYDSKRRWWIHPKAGPITKCNLKGTHISCPCANKHGRALTEKDALLSILGQLASKKFQFAIGTKRRLNRLKTSLATVKMLKCWQHKCMKPATEEKKKKSKKRRSQRSRRRRGEEDEDLSLDDFLADGLDTPSAQADLQTGAGWDCG